MRDKFNCVFLVYILMLNVEDMPNSNTSWTMSHQVPADPLSIESVKMAKGLMEERVSSHITCNVPMSTVIPS